VKLFASLDDKDRKLLVGCLSAVVALALLMGIFARNQGDDDNPLPSSYLTGKHGARAAFDLLGSSGYQLERWEQPLSELAKRADAQTVVILAEPFVSSDEESKAIEEILRKGGRVLVTGMGGGSLLPDGAAEPPRQFHGSACQLAPQGLDALAGSGQVWMVPEAGWKLTSPRFRVQYACAGEPAVVEYNEGAGHIVWWASAMPLENGSITRAQNLELFLNALGTREGHRFYWDESLHGEIHSQWFYARGTAMNLLVGGLLGLGLLIVLSFSRRKGPLRDLPLPERANPVEFLEALGSLYGKAGAAGAAVELAFARFRRNVDRVCRGRAMQMSPAELAAELRRSFPQAMPGLEADLAACDEAVNDEKLRPKKALALVQALDRHGKLMEALQAGKEQTGNSN
jgi:hypothetical protein